MRVCGVDEAGRGPVIGPLIVCGVAVDDESKLMELGVRDSKRLTPKRREELATEIRKIARVEVLELSAEEIDSLRDKMSLNEIEARCFATVIGRLDPDHAYIDAADTDEERFARMVQTHIGSPVNIISRHKADDTYPVVSAASIIAKVERDRRVREIEKEIGQPIGSGYCTDETTMSFLEDWMARNRKLPPHTRKSWEPAQTIKRMKGLRRLESFEE